MPSAYYIWKRPDSDTNREVVQLYGTQAAADTDAGTDAIYFANQGAVVISPGVGPGSIWDETDDKWRPADVSDLDATTQLKVAARAIHGQLLAWTQALADVEPLFPQKDVSLGHSLLAYGHRGVRAVFLSDHWTNAEKIAFGQSMVQGALDVTTPGEFFALLETTEIDDPDEGNEDTQRSRVIWVNPDTGVRVNLAAWKTTTDLASTNFATETTDLTDYVDGAWINDIT